jgi:hypothetical protein
VATNDIRKVKAGPGSSGALTGDAAHQPLDHQPLDDEPLDPVSAGPDPAHARRNIIEPIGLNVLTRAPAVLRNPVVLNYREDLPSQRWQGKLASGTGTGVLSATQRALVAKLVQFGQGTIPADQFSPAELATLVSLAVNSASYHPAQLQPGGRMLAETLSRHPGLTSANLNLLLDTPGTISPTVASDYGVVRCVLDHPAVTADIIWKIIWRLGDVPRPVRETLETLVQTTSFGRTALLLKQAMPKDQHLLAWPTLSLRLAEGGWAAIEVFPILLDGAGHTTRRGVVSRYVDTDELTRIVDLALLVTR